MTTITCPYCWTEAEINDDLEGCQLEDGKLITAIDCDCCEKRLEVELEVEVVGATCLTKNNSLSEEEAYLQHCDDLVDLHRDREMGFE